MKELPEKVSLETLQIDPRWAMQINPAIAMRRLALPICKLGNELIVAMAESSDNAA